MKNKTILLLLLLYSIGGFAQTPATDSNYKLIFEDEFVKPTGMSDSAYLSQKWSFLVGGDNAADSDGKHNCYCSTENGNNHRVDSGVCTLTFRNEPYPCRIDTHYDDPNTPLVNEYGFKVTLLEHTGGNLVSRLNNFRYGYYEIRCRLPDFDLTHCYDGLNVNFWLAKNIFNYFLPKLVFVNNSYLFCILFNRCA